MGIGKLSLYSICAGEVHPDSVREYGSPPTKQESEQSYFISPELGEPTMRIPFVHDLLGYDTMIPSADSMSASPATPTPSSPAISSASKPHHVHSSKNH